jgi:Immunity protein 22
MEPFDKVHLWIGTTKKSEEKYMAYFELDYSVDLDDPKYKVCGFCKDIGDVWYDEDFIGIIPRLDTPVDLDEILVDLIVAKTELKKVKKACAELGIKKANAIVWYADGTVKVPKPHKTSYNGLKYIGLFKGD